MTRTEAGRLAGWALLLPLGAELAAPLAGTAASLSWRSSASAPRHPSRWALEEREEQGKGGRGGNEGRGGGQRKQDET